MSCPNYKIIFNDETNYVAQDISEEPVVRVIPAKGEQGEIGPKGEDGKNFEPTIVSELPTTGAEGKLYLTPKNYTRGTGTGNPITISLGEDAGQITSAQLDGDTYQQSYTGKNLFNESTSTNNWVNQDGELSPNNLWRSSQLIKVTPGSTFTISGEQIGDGFMQFLWAGYDASQGFIAGQRKQINQINNATFTIGASSEYIRVGYRKDALKNIQLELGSTATAYEPFVGGQASPNPSYPQAIQTVTGEQTVTVVGKNKYPFSDVLWSTTATSTGWRFQDGAANAYGADLVGKTSYKLTLPAGSYTMTVYNIDANIISIQACTNGTGTEVIITDPYNLSSTNLSSTIALTEPTTFCVRYRVTDPSLGIGNTKIQIEKSETSTAYTPYKSTDYKINLNCNIYDRNLAYMSGNDMQIPVDITPGSSYYYGATTRWVGVYLYDASGTLVRTVGHTATTRSGSFTAASNEVKAVFTFYAGPDVTWVWSNVEFYDLAGVIELCKLDTYQDYIWKDGDDWKVHKATATITLDGTEDWVYVGNYNYARCPSYTFANIPLDNTGAQLSNYFEVIAGWGEFRESTSRNAFYPLYNSGYKISIRNTDCSSAENYKSWFATNKPSFYYPVKTPTDTVITDATLIAQLEAIRTASLETGTNTITNTATAPNLAGDMEIGYFGFNPRNRYDKWLWLDINNEYEQLNNPDTATTTAETTNLSSERNLSLTNIQSDSNEIKNDEEQENVILDDAEEEER